MNRILPFKENEISNSMATSNQFHYNVMSDNNTNLSNFPENSEHVEQDLSPSPPLPSSDHSHPVVPSLPGAVITIKEDMSSVDNQSKLNEAPNQISAIVKFIKNSFSTNRKKSEASVVNPKLICLQKISVNQQNNPLENSNSDQSNGNVNISVTSSNDIFCRFCQEFEPENELVNPCLCSGTLKYIHQSCLQRWIKIQDNRFCELCKYGFRMKVTSKPLREWQKLEMTVMEKRKIICSVTFHIIALTCVIWSLYVLIERTTEEIHNGIMEWPLWTKLIVVAIGFIGGVVFMYVQCCMYVSLCRKWHVFNRTFIVQNITSSELLAAQKEAKLNCETHLRDVSHNTSPVFGDVTPDAVPDLNVNAGLSPIVIARHDDCEFPSQTESKIYNGDLSNVRDEGESCMCESSVSTTPNKFHGFLHQQSQKQNS